MEEKLQEYAETVKNNEYQELFPDTSVEEAKKDKEKVKEALFQVHYMLYNEELYRKVREDADYYIKIQSVKKCLNDEEEKRLEKQLRGATLMEEDGETVIPKVDVQDILSPRPALRD